MSSGLDSVGTVFMTCQRRIISFQPLLHLTLGTVGYGCYLFVWFSTAAFLTPITEALELTSTQAGILTGAIPLTYVPFALLSGLVIDRVGPRRALGVGLFVVGLAHVGRGFAEQYQVMLTLTIILGLSGTALTFGLPKLVSDFFPSEWSGTLSSGYLLGLYAGTAAAFAFGQSVLGPLVGGWRPLFVWTGALTSGLAVVWYLVWLVTDTDNWGPVDADAVAGGGGPGDRSFDIRSVWRDVRNLMGQRELLLIVVIGTMYLFGVHGLQNWLTVLLSNRGLRPDFAATITSGLILAQLLGTLTLPPLSDRWGRRRLVILACGGLTALGAFALYGVGTNVPLIVLSIGASGIGLGGLATLVRSLPVDLDVVASDQTAAAVGLVFTFGEMGGFAGPFLIGLLEGLTGSLEPGLLLVGAAGVLVVVAGYPLRTVDE